MKNKKYTMLQFHRKCVEVNPFAEKNVCFLI